MILAGDGARRTQRGNNNAYNQWHGCLVGAPGWYDGSSRVLSFTLAGFDGDDDVHVVLNMDHQDLDFELPAVAQRRWRRVFDTSLPAPGGRLGAGGGAGGSRATDLSGRRAPQSSSRRRSDRAGKETTSTTTLWPTRVIKGRSGSQPLDAGSQTSMVTPEFEVSARLSVRVVRLLSSLKNRLPVPSTSG